MIVHFNTISPYNNISLLSLLLLPPFSSLLSIHLLHELQSIPDLVVNRPVQKSLLNEQLEWLIKMGFTVEDIMEWAQQAKKKRLCDNEGTFNNSTNNNNNDNDNSSSILFCANSESPQEPTCSSDSTMLTSSTHAHTEPLQETPPTLSPPPPALSDPLRRLSIVTPMDGGEALTPGKQLLRDNFYKVEKLATFVFFQMVLGGRY